MLYELTLNLTITTFNNPKKEAFRKRGEKEKMLVTSIFPFPTMLFTLSKKEIRNHNLSYIYFVIYKCFQFGHAQNFVVW